VLVLGEIPDPVPGAGEVRIRIAAASGVNPSDTKKRRMPSDKRLLSPVLKR
jgi:NADPH:quinone reductase